MKKKIKIISCDLDGTLCTQEEDYSDAKPLTERIKKLNKLFKRYKIIIDTARGSETGKDWEEITKKQLDKWKVKYHILRVGKKLAADYFIDDKAINDKDFFKLKRI